MKILVNGCSHSKCGYSTFVDESKKIIHTPLKTNVNSWQWFLAEKLNINKILSINTNFLVLPHKESDFRPAVPVDYIFEYNENDCIISLATDGKGNDSILMDTLSSLRGFENKGEKIDLVLVQFSGPTRRLVSPDNMRYAYSNPHDNFEYGLNFEPSASLITLHNMVILQDYLKKGGYDYYFLNYFPLNGLIKEETIYNELDLSKFISYKDTHPIFDGWIDNIKKDGLAVDEYGHPNVDLMKIISDEFFLKIKNTRDLL